MKDRVGAAAAYLATINLSAGADVVVSAEDVSPSDRQGDARRSSPNTICRERKRCRTTRRPIRRAWSGTATSARTCSACSIPKTGKVDRVSAAHHQARRAARLARPRARQAGKHLDGHDVPGSLAKFDRKTKTFQTWGSPDFKNRDEARIAMVMPINADVDGQVWIGGDNEYQVDVKTGEWKTVDYGVGVKDAALVKELSSYGVSSDSKNNFYGMNLNGTYIIKVDAKTKKVTPYPTPTPNAGPRRGHMDAQDRLWFAEFRGNKIAMFDTKTEKFQEWPVRDAVDQRLRRHRRHARASRGRGGMNNDRVVRVNTKTGEVVEYVLPRMTNIRRVNVDNGSNPPAFWVGGLTSWRVARRVMSQLSGTDVH